MKDSEEKEDLIDEIFFECDPFTLIDDEDDLSDYIGIDDISKEYKVEIEMRYKEDDEKLTDDMELYVVKYKGKWRMVADPFGLI